MYVRICTKKSWCFYFCSTAAAASEKQSSKLEGEWNMAALAKHAHYSSSRVVVRAHCCSTAAATAAAVAAAAHCRECVPTNVSAAALP